MPWPIIVPLLNPNEPEARLVAVHVAEGQRVSAGDVLCTLETTKSTSELVAEKTGFVVGLRFKQGDLARAGEVLCYLADTPDWKPPQAESPPIKSGTQVDIPAGLRITKPALTLAQAHNLDLSKLPPVRMITVSVVRGLLDKTPARTDFVKPSGEFDPTAILIYGGGGHGKTLIDLLRTLGTYRIAGVVDDSLPIGEIVMGFPVLGGGEVLTQLHDRGLRLAVNAVGGIGDITIRLKVFQRIAEAGLVCPSVAHPSAVIEPSATLAAGVQVFPHAYVGSEVSLGFGAIVNTGAVISHDCQLGICVNISPGALLAGGVWVGDGALIGMGVTVNLGVKIGAKARVGNGATVKADVEDGGVVHAGTIWPA